MSDQAQAAQSGAPGFKKEIGLFSGINVLVGIIIGSGIFYLGIFVLGEVKLSMGFALLAWAIGGLISLLGGLCFAELGAMNPKAGGMYNYLSDAYHPALGFSNEWTSIFISGAGSNAALALVFANAISRLVEIDDMSIKLIAIASILVLSCINFFGVKFGALVQNVFTMAKVIPIVLILVWGIFAGKESPNINLTIPAGVDGFGGVVTMIALGVIMSMWAYDGWTNLNAVAEEIKNPQKNLPRAIIIALSSITLLYVLFNFAIFRILPISEIMSHEGPSLSIKAGETIMGSPGLTLVAITILISVFGSLNGCIMSFPRSYYAVARDGHFIPAYSLLHKKYATPWVAIVIQCVISIILVMLRNLGQLTALVVFASILYKMITVFSVIIFRKKQPNTPRPYKVPFTYVTVIIATLSMLGILISVLINMTETSIIGLAIPLSGILVYFLFFNKNKSIIKLSKEK